MYDDHTDDYNELFELIDKHVNNEIKPNVKAESIFLTHNEKMHKHNVDNNIKGEDYLWKPGIQESKMSQYGGKNIRYKYRVKRKYINDFTNNHRNIIPWQTIRYIF